MKFSCGNHFLSGKQIRAERIRLDAAWSDYRAVGQAVVLPVMELLDSKRSATISQRGADQSLKATLFGLAPVWYRTQVADGAIGGTPISRWTSAGVTKEEKHENETEIVFKLSERPDSASEWDRAETLRQPLFTDFYYIPAEYPEDQRVNWDKGSKEQKKHDVIAWNTVEGELAASFTLHVEDWLTLWGGASPR